MAVFPDPAVFKRDGPWPYLRRQKDQEGSVRSAAAAVQPLVDALDDADAGFRLLAIDVLGQIGLPAISALQETLRSRDPRLREAAAAALANIPEGRVPQPCWSGCPTWNRAFARK